jgi:D-cysteine desulfhydrase
VSILFAHYPTLGERLPWEPLLSGPTPIELSPGLADGVWVKRDDLTSRVYGGNKVRKLEFLLADARARGHRSLLTVGATGSNHVLATALFGRALGFAATHAVLFPQPAGADVARKERAFAEAAVGAARVPGKLLVPFGAAWRAAIALARGQGRPYLIGPGGSSPLGSLGYVAAGLELAAQVRAGECPAPSEIWVPVGSGGTAAGLLVGLRLAGLSARLHAVQVVERPWVSAGGVVRLARRIAALLVGLGVDLPPRARRYRTDDLVLVTDQLGPGYAHPTPASKDACARAADAGLVLDTTYAGKTLAGLLARPAAGPRLFWLTYFGSPT